jgi:hypothetical protein
VIEGPAGTERIRAGFFLAHLAEYNSNGVSIRVPSSFERRAVFDESRSVAVRANAGTRAKDDLQLMPGRNSGELSCQGTSEDAVEIVEGVA